MGQVHLEGAERRRAGRRQRPTFILKPVGSCQGKGIFLTRDWANVPQDGRAMVAQLYIPRPLLIDGLKVIDMKSNGASAPLKSPCLLTKPPRWSV